MISGCSLGAKPDLKDNQEVVTGESTTVPSPQVSLRTGEDLIRNFFDLINDKKAAEAIDLMALDMVAGDNGRKMWQEQFQVINSVKIVTVEPFLPSDWTDSRQMFKVGLEVAVADTAAQAPIPYYGWQDNPNFRWITVEKNDDGLWRMAEIATGP